VAIPVLGAPTETAVDDTREVDLPTRERGLEDLLAERDVSEGTIAAAPSSWAVVGTIVLADFGDVSTETTLDADEREIVGESLLELHGNADTVLARGGVSGTRREPSPDVVAGAGETETVHVEHGTKYAVDFSKVMFSPGNKAERARMGDVVEPGERVFDMFAGIGYFTLPMARAGAEVTAAEINPESYRLLVENARLNHVSDHIEAILGDCRDVETTADRVVMGYYDAHEYLDSALDTLASDGTLHLHEATPQQLFPDRPIDRLTAAADEAGRTVEIADTRVVKSHSEGVVHGVVDAVVE
jgi:tRNA wybutosine-synthesizing protein 2